MRDHSGNLKGFIGISRDISDRKRIEEKLRESERKLRTVFGTIRDGLVITAMTGIIVDANEAAIAQALLDASNEEGGELVEDFVS
jgi:PAS domain-containing protein